MVILYVAELSAVPSLTLKVKPAKLSPYSLVGGVYLRLPASMSLFATDWPAATAAPPSISVPEAGSATILTL